MKDKKIRVLETTWKMWNEIFRILNFPKVWISFEINHISWGRGWRFNGVPIIQKNRNSIMNFGNNLFLRSSLRSNPLGPNHPVILCTWNANSVIDIGDNFGMTGGTICAAEKIIIGNNVSIGANTTIVDTDFHPLNSDNRIISPQNGETSPVFINDNVFIGMNCLILKGVTIGKGSVIGAGSVVTKNIPAGVIAAGNPARVIRFLSEE